MKKSEGIIFKNKRLWVDTRGKSLEPLLEFVSKNKGNTVIDIQLTDDWMKVFSEKFDLNRHTYLELKKIYDIMIVPI